MTPDQWIALGAVLFSILSAVVIVVWTARGVQSTTEHLGDRMDRSNENLGTRIDGLGTSVNKLADKVDGQNLKMVEHGERIVKIETRMGLEDGGE